MSTQTINKTNKNISHKSLYRWLFICCGMIFCIVIIGAITRLTNSGLSMVEWRPLLGTLPPLNETEWIRIFDLYKQSPEFQKEHFCMSLPDFKMIFFWEWFHRFLGRTIGLVYALPLLYFWVRGLIPPRYKLPLIGLLILGGAQGFMGWFMVQSGLVNEPSVSHYRLTAHLSLAFLLFSFLLWTGLNLRTQPKKRAPHKALYVQAWITIGFYIITVFWGAFTAGLDAGLIYNETFPKMGKTWIPADMWHAQPAIANIFENHSAVQFTHRWLAMITALITLGFWTNTYRQNHATISTHALALMILIQIGLGITTLFTHIALPIATMHQAGALIVLTLLIINLHRLKPPKAQHPA